MCAIFCFTFIVCYCYYIAFSRILFCKTLFRETNAPHACTMVSAWSRNGLLAATEKFIAKYMLTGYGNNNKKRHHPQRLHENSERVLLLHTALIGLRLCSVKEQTMLDRVLWVVMPVPCLVCLMDKIEIITKKMCMILRDLKY